MTFSQIIQIIAVLLTGLAAGFFYSYQCSVTGGLGKLSDREYLTAFQALNEATLNPWFYASFIGCLFVLPLASWLSFNAGVQTSFYFLLSATVVYFTGTFGITMLVNVPLNEMLANFNIGASTEKDLLSLRDRFEPSWNKYHLIRTVAVVLSFLLTILAMLKK